MTHGFTSPNMTLCPRGLHWVNRVHSGSLGYRVCEDSSGLAREVIAFSPLVPFYLGKVKSSTSALTRSSDGCV